MIRISEKLSKGLAGMIYRIVGKFFMSNRSSL
jgi:hypothetical protein